MLSKVKTISTWALLSTYRKIGFRQKAFSKALWKMFVAYIEKRIQFMWIDSIHSLNLNRLHFLSSFNEFYERNQCLNNRTQKTQSLPIDRRTRSVLSRRDKKIQKICQRSPRNEPWSNCQRRTTFWQASENSRDFIRSQSHKLVSFISLATTDQPGELIALLPRPSPGGALSAPLKPRYSMVSP